MAWSDHKFSDQYGNARTVLRDETFPDPFKDAQMSLQRVMGDSGFDASSVKALDDLRRKATSVTTGEAPGTQEDGRLLAAAGHTGAPGASLDAPTRKKAAALKFLRHIYLLKQRGGQKVWLHSLPTDFNDWPHWALETGSSDAARTLLRSTNQRFTAEQEKNLSDGIQDALRWCQKTLMLLGSAGGAGQAKADAMAMIKRWFADENSDDTQLASHISDLTAGFKAITGALNRNQIVLTDFPTLRTATGDKEKGLRNSEAFVWAKAHREALDVIYIEDAFFGDRNVLKGKANWARIVVHELSHLVYGTKDVSPGPRYAWYGIAPNAANFSSDKAITNAENWAFFCADCAGAISDSERGRALTVK